MITNSKKKEDNIISTISSLRANKNPISIIFAIADLKEIFINICESLLINIEQNYSKKARHEYLSIVCEFKKEGIYEASYNHYINNHGVNKFKDAIDDYFEHSFFTDISFFYYTLSKVDKYGGLFEVLEKFYSSPDFKNIYFSLDGYLAKKDLLKNNFNIIDNIKTDSEIYFIVSFLDYFNDFDFSLISPSFNNGISADVKVIKNITIFIFSNDKYIELKDLFIKNFLNNCDLYSKVIEHFEEEKIYDVISFLRKDITSYISIQSTLDYKSKKLVKDYSDIAYKIGNKDINDKISFLINKENDFIKMPELKGDIARITFKRLLLEKKYPYLIDLTLGITSLPQDVFHLYKQKTQSLDIESLKLYSEIKDLILFIDKSFLLNLAKPFILKKIAHYFNSSDQKYYIIKFILCVVLPDSYSEYKKISKFFYNLESFYRNNLEAMTGRFMQYGWIYIILVLLFFIAPLGVLIAGLILFIKEIILKVVSKINPKIKMSFNFQIGGFASSFGILAIILGGTIGYKDNINTIYDNFKGTINAITIPANESLKLIANDLKFLRSDLLNFDNKTENLGNSLYDIDYMKGITLSDLKLKKDDDEDLEETNYNYNIDNLFSIDKKETNLVFRIDNNNTFWDYADSFARSCNINTNLYGYNKFLSENLEDFLIRHRVELLQYINSGGDRLSIWSIAKRLPAIDFNLESLYDGICK